MIPREGQVSLDTIARILSSAATELGISDTCQVRSVLVYVEGRWLNHCTVLMGGAGDGPAKDELEDVTAGSVRLIRSEFSAEMIVDAGVLRDVLTTWGVTFPGEYLAMLRAGAFGPGVAPQPWDFPDTANVYHQSDRRFWNQAPCWVIEVYDRAQGNRGLSAPRGPFKNFEQDLYWEDLGAAAESWTGDRSQRDNYSTVADTYRIVIPDKRGVIARLERQGDELHVTVSGSKLALVGAVTARDKSGSELRDKRAFTDGHAVFRLPRLTTSVDLFVFDDSDVWCDCYREGEGFRPWGRAIAVPANSEPSIVGGETARIKAPSIFDEILLEPDQVELFQRLVEAWRSTPRDQRQKFMVAQAMGGDHLVHPSLGPDQNDVYFGDVEALAAAGLLNLTYGSGGTPQFDITPLGFRYYEHCRVSSGKAAERVQEVIRTYLDSNVFSRRYPQAHAKWTEAERLLWSTDSAQQLTTIGHLCREALQFFATALVERVSPPDVDQDPAHTIARLRSVLALVRKSAPDATCAMLDALLTYWRAVSDVVQRQEHGAQKEGRELVWSDGRRLVFHAALVMYECDQLLDEARL